MIHPHGPCLPPRPSARPRLRKSRLAVALLAASGTSLILLAGLRAALAQPALSLAANGTATPADDAQPITAAQCAACHVPEKVLSHPVGMQPSMPVPAALPLVNGTVACTTCHLDSFTAHAAATADHPLLRGDASPGASFCNQCHTAADLTAHGQHPRAMAQAHFGWLKSGFPGTPTQAKLLAGDGVYTCLSCHDGTIASDQYGGLGGSSSGKTRTSHAVAVNYQAAQTHGTTANLLPATMVDHRVLLPNGQVTCLSCHSLFSREAGLLVVRNDHSLLCSSCHRE
jgi:hypothetical protein